MAGKGAAQLVGGDRFELRERIGGGAAGDVYRVHDRERGSEVALKVLKKGDPTALYRFKHEFRALADVAHPNLVEYYELVAREDQWFLTMELIDGVDFLTYVREGLAAEPAEADHPSEPRRRSGRIGSEWDQEEDTAVTQTGSHMPQRRGLRYPGQFERLRKAFAQLVSGVQALHEAGHLHRDIKPSNILIGREDERLVILDFGVITELAQLDRAGDGDERIVGTPAYMAPEQSAGEPLSMGSDWYSVGVVIYEAITGGRPFGGSVRSSLEARMRFDPPPPSTFAPGVSSDLDELCMMLLRRDPDERPDGDEILRRLGVRHDSRPIMARAKPAAGVELVGREPHLTALRNAFDEACRGRSHAVLVHGAAGMGKTALIQTFLREISDTRRAILLEGRCYEHESMPYKALDPLVDVLSRYLLSLPAAEVEQVIPSDVGALARLFPVLRRVEAVVGGGESVEAITPAELRRRAVGALRELVSSLASKRPLVLYIDDLQWGDTDSAALIQELLRPPQTPGMLFLASYRSEDAKTSPFLRALLPLPSVPIEIALEALSSAEALVVAERLLGGVSEILPTIGRSIARESGGNPFFVHELVRYVQAETFSDMSLGTITLEEVIRVRLSELPPPARRMLDVIAVAGHPVSPAAARRAAELEGELDSAVHMLRTRNLIRTRGGDERLAGAMEPYHDRIREVAVSLLSERQLRDVHRNLAVALSVEAEPDPEALADHFQGAGDVERAAQYCAQAAEQASRALAFQRAAELYRRALAMGSHPPAEEARLRGELARALGDAGRGAEAAEVYRQAAAVAPAGEAVTYRRLAGEHLLRVGHFDEGIEIIAEVINELGLRVPSSRFGSILSLLWQRLQLRFGGIRYKVRDASEIAPAVLHRLDACWSTATGLAMVDTIQGLDFQTRHLLLALRTGEPYRLARALAIEAGYATTSGVSGRKRTDRLLREASNLLDGLDAPDVGGWIMGIQGLAAYQRGEFARSLALSRQAESIIRHYATTLFFEQTSVVLYQLWAMFYVGELGEIARTVPVVLQEAEGRGDLYSATNFSTGLCVAAWLTRDEPDEIRVLGQEAIGRWSHRDYHLQHYWYFVGCMLTELYAGDPDRIRAALDEHWSAYEASQMHRIEFVRHEAWSLRARALLSIGRSPDEDRKLLKQARTLARKLRRRKLPYGVGWGLLVEAAVSARRGDSAGAIDLLDDAIGLFSREEMRLHRAAAEWRRGELIGGAEGEAAVAAARDAFAAEGVRRPEQMLRVHAPGFP